MSNFEKIEEEVQYIAKELDGVIRGFKIPEELQTRATLCNIVIAYGESDDLLELRCGIDDEIGAWNGTSIFVNKDGLFSECESNCEHSQAKKKECEKIKLVWGEDIGNPLWHFETKILHATFKIYDEYNGEKFVFCEGIVFCLDLIEKSI